MPDAKRAIALLMALGLLAGIAFSVLRLAELRSVEDALEAASRHVGAADIERASAELYSIQANDSDLSARQRENREELVVRLVKIGLRRSPPVQQIGGQEFTGAEGTVYRVAFSRPSVVVGINPPALRKWVHEVRLGKRQATITEDEATTRFPFPIPDRGGRSGEPIDVPVSVVVRVPDGGDRVIEAGAFKIVLDRKCPVVTVGVSPSHRVFETPALDEVRITVAPGKPPPVFIEDHVGLQSVRWRVNGTPRSKSFADKGVLRWQLPLQDELFAKSGNDVKLSVEPENQLGNPNKVVLLLAVRGTGYNPVARILVDGTPLDQNATAVVSKPRVTVVLEMRPGEDAGQLTIRAGGRHFPVTRRDGAYRAVVDLVEGTPTGLSLLKGTRVLASYKLIVKGS